MALYQFVGATLFNPKRVINLSGGDDIPTMAKAAHAAMMQIIKSPPDFNREQLLKSDAFEFFTPPPFKTLKMRLQEWLHALRN